MNRPTSYNGHKNYNHWNVSLWLNNDEGLYDLCLQAINRHRFKKGALSAAAYSVMAFLPETTPDGVKYSASSIRAAMSDMRETGHYTIIKGT